jgi:hypothetical protein
VDGDTTRRHRNLPQRVSSSVMRAMPPRPQRVRHQAPSRRDPRSERIPTATPEVDRPAFKPRRLKPFAQCVRAQCETTRDRQLPVIPITLAHMLRTWYPAAVSIPRTRAQRWKPRSSSRTGDGRWLAWPRLSTTSPTLGGFSDAREGFRD